LKKSKREKKEDKQVKQQYNERSQKNQHRTKQAVRQRSNMLIFESMVVLKKLVSPKLSYKIWKIKFHYLLPEKHGEHTFLECSMKVFV